MPMNRAMHQHSAPQGFSAPEENELPNLLQHDRLSKTADRKFRDKSMARRESRSFGGGEEKSPLQNEFSAQQSDAPANAFPLKAEPLVRWRAAAKIQSYLAKFRSSKTSISPAEVCKVEVRSHQPRTHHWPEEPDAPSREDLEALTELEAMLLKQHSSIAAAFKFISNCVRTGKADGHNFNKREFRIALHLKCSKEAAFYNLAGDKLEQMFDKLLRLFRKRGDEITKADFLRFPELLSREKTLQQRLLSSGDKMEQMFDICADDEMLIGDRLQERLEEPIGSSEEARDLLQKAAVALELEPCRSTNVLFQIASSSCSSGAIPSRLASSISHILQIAHEFGSPTPGVKLDVLLAGWNLCQSLAKQVVALGVPPTSSPPPHTSEKFSKTSRVATKFRKKLAYQRKVDVGATQPAQDHQHQSYENDCNEVFWQVVSTEEVLWNLGCGAEVLNDEDFKTLLYASWTLFDSFDAVGRLLGPVGWGRLRPKLDALAALSLQPQVLRESPVQARLQLQNAGVLLQQIASICEADPRLARISGLFGASFLADRLCSTANASVNLLDGFGGSAAAQVNRSAAAVGDVLRRHVE